MEERAVELYRTRGAEVYARCRRLLGDEDAVAATPLAFAAVQERLDDSAHVERVTREVCARRRRLLLVPADKQVTAAELADAEERFARDVYQRTLPIVLREQRPPRLLRRVFFLGLLVVCLGAALMLLAVYGLDRAHGSLDVYVVRGGRRTRLATGMIVRPGEELRVVVTPAGQRSVVVHLNGRVHERLEGLDPLAGRIELTDPVVVEDEGHLRISAGFGPSPRSQPSHEAAIELKVD